MTSVDPMVRHGRVEAVPSGARPLSDEAGGAFGDTLRTLLDRSADRAGEAAPDGGGASMFNEDGLLGGAATGGGLLAEEVSETIAMPASSPLRPAEEQGATTPAAPKTSSDIVPEARAARLPSAAGKGVASHRADHARGASGFARHGAPVSTALPLVERPAARIAGNVGPAPTARASRPAANTRQLPVDLLLQIGGGAATLAVRVDGAEPEPDGLVSEVTALLARHGLVLDELRVNGRPAGAGSQRRG